MKELGNYCVPEALSTLDIQVLFSKIPLLLKGARASYRNG
jgi:hypothetical protein